MHTHFSLMITRGCSIAGILAAGFLYLAGWDSQAQTVISGGTRMTVSPGTMVHSTDHFAIQNGGSVSNKGTLILKRNLINQNGTPNAVGSGLVIFAGSAGQTVAGQNIFQGLTLNNPSGLTLQGNTGLNGILTLASGRMTLGAFNLLLGGSAQMQDDIGCPGPLCPCPGNGCWYVIATGTGQFRKVFEAPGSFTFRVGDDSEATGYSPVNLTFNSGSFGTGNYAGVNLVNAKYPGAGISGSYLNRYWNVSQNNISAFTCNAEFRYLPEDVVGNEHEIWSFRVDQVPWVAYRETDTVLHRISASGLSAFGTFTGNKGTGGPLPPAVRSLQDMMVASGDAHCFDAQLMIVAAGNGTLFEVQNGGDVHLVAGQKITLLPGLKVYAGGIFHGYITSTGQYCENVKSNDATAGAGDLLNQPGSNAAGYHFRVYPNPTTGKFTLETADGFILPGSTMEVYGSRGDRILSASLFGNQKQEFSLHGSPPGLYFIRVIAGQNAETTKIIKQ